MFWLVLGMTLAVALAAFVLGIVALPARRAGRPTFTERGERVFRLSDSDTQAPRRPKPGEGENHRGAKRFKR